MWSNAPFKRPVAHAAGHATRIRGLSFEGPDAPLDDFHALFDDLDMRVGNRAGLRAGRARQRFIHDAADRSRAAATLRAAPETPIDLVGRGRAGSGIVDGGPHVAVAEDVAGTNDHLRYLVATRLHVRFVRSCVGGMQKEKRCFDRFQGIEKSCV
jgi:hypothetical protein